MLNDFRSIILAGNKFYYLVFFQHKTLKRWFSPFNQWALRGV
ncbi:MAG: hypothetical protein RL179_2524 [Planctomycetota bacterium]|jgi:hypothetical protein